MPRQGRPSALHQKLEAIIEQCRQPLDTKRIDTARRNLDCQRNPIEPSADRGDERCIFIGKREIAAARRGPFNEKLDRRKGQGLRCREFRGVVWDTQGRQAINMLAFSAQALPARCQDEVIFCFLEDFLSEDRRRLDDILAAVEHDQNVFLFQELDQRRQGIVGPHCDAEAGSQRTRSKQRVGQRCKIDEADTVFDRVEGAVRNGNRNRRLSDAARTNNRDKSMLCEPLDKIGDDIGSAHHARQRRRHVSRPCHTFARDDRFAHVGPAYRSDE